MNVKALYHKDKTLFIAIALIATGFIISGTILAMRWYKKKQMGKMKANGLQKSTEDFLQAEEGRRNDVYLDEAGLLTVGIGHRVTANDGLALGDKITDSEVDDYFRRDTRTAVNEVSAAITAPLNQNQFDALVSLIYNIGAGGFDHSTLRKYINGKKTKQDISNAWLAWDHEHKNNVLVESQKLKARRQREIDLFFS